MKTDAAYVWTCLRPRPRDSHKGTFGAVLAVAGSALSGLFLLAAGFVLDRKGRRMN